MQTIIRLFILVLVAAICGCGGSDSGSNSTSGSPAAGDSTTLWTLSSTALAPTTYLINKLGTDGSFTLQSSFTLDNLTPRVSAYDATLDLLYITDSIDIYAVIPDTGAIASVTSSLTNPVRALLIDADTLWAVTAGTTANDLSFYTVDRTTGALTLIKEDLAIGNINAAMTFAFDASLHTLYISHSGDKICTVALSNPPLAVATESIVGLNTGISGSRVPLATEGALLAISKGTPPAENIVAIDFANATLSTLFASNADALLNDQSPFYSFSLDEITNTTYNTSNNQLYFTTFGFSLDSYYREVLVAYDLTDNSLLAVDASEVIDYSPSYAHRNYQALWTAP